MTADNHSDLAELLNELLSSVDDSRFIWCTKGFGFETGVEHRSGILLGGAITPLFLDEPGGQCILNSTRILGVATGEPQTYKAWVPILEAVVENNEELLVIAVAEDISKEELLATLIINSQRGTLSCCVIRQAGRADDTITLPAGTIDAKRAKIVDQLPLVSEVWVRRAAAVAFLDSDNDFGCPISQITVVNVGGADVEDQASRLEFFRKAIRDEDARQGYL